MLINNKIKTYFGFAIKSRNIIYGGDNLLASRSKIYVVLCSKDINRTALKSVQEYCENKRIKLFLLETEFIEEVSQKMNCKCVAVCDRNLANGIINELSGGFNE